MVLKSWFLQLLVVCVSDWKDYMANDIEAGPEVHNRTVWKLELHRLVVEGYCVRNWMVIILVHSGVVPSFVESMGVLRLVISGSKVAASMTRL